MPRTKKSSFNKKNVFISLAFVCVVVSLISLFLHFKKQPSNQRDWQEEFAVMPQVKITGDVVEISDVRDWRYDDNGPLTKNYVNRSFNVNDLERVWFLLEPFSGWDGVAHTYFVFDFKDAEPISFSVEARREKGEHFNTFQGLFRKFDLIYLWGTEKDFTVNRVVTYNNQVYMFPLTTSTDANKKLFLELAAQTADLYERPRFYNTLTSNCTSILADFANRVQRGAIPLHYARVLPGYSGKLLHRLGYIDHTVPYDELKKKYHINPYVEKYFQEENFSDKLREELN